MASICVLISRMPSRRSGLLCKSRNNSTAAEPWRCPGPRPAASSPAERDQTRGVLVFKPSCALRVRTATPLAQSMCVQRNADNSHGRAPVNFIITRRRRKAGSVARRTAWNSSAYMGCRVGAGACRHVKAPEGVLPDEAQMGRPIEGPLHVRHDAGSRAGRRPRFRAFGQPALELDRRTLADQQVAEMPAEESEGGAADRTGFARDFFGRVLQVFIGDLLHCTGIAGIGVILARFCMMRCMSPGSRRGLPATRPAWGLARRAARAEWAPRAAARPKGAAGVQYPRIFLLCGGKVHQAGRRSQLLPALCLPGPSERHCVGGKQDKSSEHSVRSEGNRLG